MASANSVRRYLLSECPWVNPESTVDTVKAGDGDREVHKAAVCWFPSITTIRTAHEAGCELLICHEPMFWEHSADELSWRTQEPGVAKQRLLDETGLVVLRAHDTWDQWPELGIRDSWAAFLGLDKRIYASEKHNYHGVYEIPEEPLRGFAQRVADRVRELGEDSVQVMGPPEMLVRHPAVGVGCICPDQDAIDHGADVLIVCFDGTQYWRDRERFREAGAAVITVEHGTSEMPGMESLCRHLAGQFPDVAFEYLADHPQAWTVRGRA